MTIWPIRHELALGERARRAFEGHLARVQRWTDRFLGRLLAVEWVVCLAGAVWLSPRLWDSQEFGMTAILPTTIVAGGLIVALAAGLIRLRSGRTFTRHAVAVAMMLMASLLIQLTRGQIEAHFVLIGSLALLSSYRDERVLYGAATVALLDHVLRGWLWPESIYGVPAPDAWTWVIHSGWICFELAFLVRACRRAAREMRELAARNDRLAVARNTSDHQAQESARRLEVAELQLVSASKLESVGQLAAGVAHEVKNPLGVILLGITYLRQQLPDSNSLIATMLTDMQDAVERADTVVRDLLDLSTPRELAVESGSLHEEIEACLRLLHTNLIAAHVSVVRHFEPDLPDVAIDRQKIHQVLVNLILNACHAMQDDGGTLTVHTHAETLKTGDPWTGRRRSDIFSDGQRVVVVDVEDTGAGLDQEILEHAFDPFISTRPTGEGSGLGLSVARKIMDIHAGSLDLVNQDHGGARATVRFPIPAQNEGSCSNASCSSTMKSPSPGG